jgi:hypothetical protein
MSPESPTPTPKQEMITVPDWSEKQPKVETVSIMRSDGSIESDWVVNGMDDISVFVSKTEGGIGLTKRVKRSDFESLNGSIETGAESVSSETSEALGEVALEQVGLGDLENAKIFTSEELRALRGESAEDNNQVMPESVEEEERDEVFDALPSEVQREVLNYRTAVGNQVEARRRKDYAQAAEDGRSIFAVQQSLSPQAKRYLGL